MEWKNFSATHRSLPRASNRWAHIEIFLAEPCAV
jgi:hypothetical protein